MSNRLPCRLCNKKVGPFLTKKSWYCVKCTEEKKKERERYLREWKQAERASLKRIKKEFPVLYDEIFTEEFWLIRSRQVPSNY